MRPSCFFISTVVRTTIGMPSEIKLIDLGFDLLIGQYLKLI